MTGSETSRLAVDGGPPVRRMPWPKRHLFDIEEKQAAVRVFDRSIETGEPFGYNGPEEEAYCREFADSLGGGFVDAVNSGTSSVYVALRCLDLQPFSEVIVPPVSDAGGVMPVPLMNCIPVPADALPGSYNTGADQIRARLSERTSAIVVAHISGIPCDMDPIMELAAERGLPVIEDCAQAHGATYKGRPVGTIGDVGAFSTMSGKHHASAAQGGLVFTRREELYWRARRCADRGKPFGLSGQTQNVVASLNFNSNELACAVGRVQIGKLPGIVHGRRRFAQAMAQGCESLRVAKPVMDPPDARGSFWFLFLRVSLDQLKVDKQQFVKALAAEGTPFGDSYPHFPSMAQWFRERAVFGASGYPWSAPEYKGNAAAEYPIDNALATDATHIWLAMHERCGEQEVADAIAALRKVEAAYAR